MQFWDAEGHFQQTCDRKSSSHYPFSLVQNLGKPPLEAFVIQLREAERNGEGGILELSSG
jgi:hypothetical protein